MLEVNQKMAKEQPNTTTAPGERVEMKVEQAKAVGHPADGTAVGDFAQIKPLLSSKPIRRPNRTKPLS
jgi:hypothetical protein